MLPKSIVFDQYVSSKKKKKNFLDKSFFFKKLLTSNYIFISKYIKDILSISIPIIPVIKLNKSRNSLKPSLSYRFVFKNRRNKHNYILLSSFSSNKQNITKLFIC